MFKSKFQIEEGPIYEGYTKGNHWNGWACPYFTKEVADQIAREVNADAPDCTMCYDKAMMLSSTRQTEMTSAFTRQMKKVCTQ